MNKTSSSLNKILGTDPFMIYSWSGSDLVMVIGAVIVTRFIAIFVALGALRGLIAIGLLHD